MKSNILLLAFLLVSLGLSAQYGGTYSYHNGSHNDNHSYRDNDNESHYYNGNRSQEKIQIALILDVSGSMEGLLDQARSQLWYIVNGLMMDYEYGRGPVLEIALYELGNESLGPHSGYMRQVVPFTRNLDWLSEELFYLRIGGRYEYYGESVMMAMDQLNWSRRPSDLKLMYIAGNEDFDQGRVDFRDAIRMAVRQDVIVNTIYCGTYQKGISFGWKRAADYGNGDYMNIDHNYHIHYDPTPQDNYYYEMNTRLNATYIPYGSNGRKLQERQLEQDRNANRYGKVNQSQRTLTKASNSYRNEEWDLIDALDAGIISIENVSPNDLPSEMRNMSIPQRKNYVAQKKAERVRVQSEIRSVAKQNVQTEVKTQPVRTPAQGNTVQKPQPQVEETQTFDKAIIQSVKKRQMESGSVRQSPVEQKPVQVEQKPAPVELKKQEVEQKPKIEEQTGTAPRRPIQSQEQIRQRVRQF